MKDTTTAPKQQLKVLTVVEKQTKMVITMPWLR